MAERRADGGDFPRSAWKKVRPYASSAAVTGACTFACWLMFPHFELADLIMVYLIGVVLVSTRLGLRHAIFAAATSVLAFDFFFVPPYLTFAVADLKHVVTFGVMFVVAVVIGGLTDRVRLQREAAELREQRTSVLYALSRELGGSRERATLSAVAARHFADMFACKTAILLGNASGDLEEQPCGAHDYQLTAAEREVARWVWDHNGLAGRGAGVRGDAEALYLPLVGARERIGVLGILLPDQGALDADQRNMAETFAGLLAGAIERAMLAEQAQRAQVQMEAESLRSGLLSSVSHDLRTPLATIEGAASTLLASGNALGEKARVELTRAIIEESGRLSRLVRNLLDVTRLESGELQMQREWEPVEEVVGATLSRLEKQLGDRPIETRVPADLPLVPMDTVLIGQVLLNLLENAIKYAPAKTPIEISARVEGKTVVLEIADRGPGLRPGDERRVFEKFFRSNRSPNDGGAGLGLAICRSIVLAHGGTIWAENRKDGGASFRFSLPLAGSPPKIDGLPAIE